MNIAQQIDSDCNKVRKIKVFVRIESFSSRYI